MTKPHESKNYERERDEAGEYLQASDAVKGLRHCVRIGFDKGAAYERRRAAKLVEALVMAIEDINLGFKCPGDEEESIGFFEKVLAAYEEGR